MKYNILKLIGFISLFYYQSIVIAESVLNILYVLDEFPKFNQPFVLNQIIGLKKKGHHITILADHERYPDMIPLDIKKYNLLYETYYKRLPKHKKKFDIICCNFGQNGCWANEMIKDHKLKGKLVTIFQGADLTKLTQKNKTKVFTKLGDYKISIHNEKMYYDLFKRGHAFLGVCSYFKKKIQDLGADSKKTFVHFNCIDCDKFCFRPRSLEKREKVKIVSSGRLVEKKGIEYAIKAVALLANLYPNIEYNIIGDGPLRQRFEKLIIKLGMIKKIKILGWRTQEQVVKILDDSHIFLLPSVTAQSKESFQDQEGMPTVIIEAMAMGLPVISTFHSGIPEIVKDGITGYLCKERDVSELFRLLKKMIDQSANWSLMGQRARAIIEKECDIDRQTKKLSKLFFSLMKK